MAQSRTGHGGVNWKISLRVRHPSADPATFDEVLGLTPFRAWRFGDDHQTPRGAALEGRYTDSYATYELAEGRGSLAAGIEHVLDEIGAPAQRLVALGAQLELFVGWFFHNHGNTGDVFPPALLGRLADMRLALSLDLYG